MDYPWGEAETDPERANFDQNVGALTPVGLYLSGAGPYGHLDLAGNDWEWCSDRAEFPQEDEEKYGKGYVLKGGGWLSSTGFLAVAIRNRLFADGRSVSFGFRVSVVRAST